MIQSDPLASHAAPEADDTEAWAIRLAEQECDAADLDDGPSADADEASHASLRGLPQRSEVHVATCLGTDAETR